MENRLLNFPSHHSVAWWLAWHFAWLPCFFDLDINVLREKQHWFLLLTVSADVTNLLLENDFIKIVKPNKNLKLNELSYTDLRRPPLHWYLTALGFCRSGCMVALLSTYFPSVFLYCLLLPYGRWCWPWRMFPQRVPCTGAPVSEQLQHLGTKTLFHWG